MKTTDSKQKIAETIIGAAIGAAIAGPAGAVVGALAGHEAAAHTGTIGDRETAPRLDAGDADDPMRHSQVKRILVPVDFSESSRQALRFARDWALRFGAEMCLLHVLEPTPEINAFPDVLMVPPIAAPDFRERARVELEKLALQEIPASIKASQHIRVGVAYDEIANTARELVVDLIVISTDGRTGLMHALIGSTAERVVRHAPCPVLTLRRALES